MEREQVVTPWRLRNNDALNHLLTLAMDSLQPNDVVGASSILELISMSSMPMPLFLDHMANFQSTKTVAALRLLKVSMENRSVGRASLIVTNLQPDGRLAIVCVDLLDGDTVVVPVTPDQAEGLATQLWKYVHSDLKGGSLLV